MASLPEIRGNKKEEQKKEAPEAKVSDEIRALTVLKDIPTDRPVEANDSMKAETTVMEQRMEGEKMKQELKELPVSEKEATPAKAKTTRTRAKKQQFESGSSEVLVQVHSVKKELDEFKQWWQTQQDLVKPPQAPDVPVTPILQKLPKSYVTQQPLTQATVEPVTLASYTPKTDEPVQVESGIRSGFVDFGETLSELKQIRKLMEKRPPERETLFEARNGKPVKKRVMNQPSSEEGFLFF